MSVMNTFWKAALASAILSVPAVVAAQPVPPAPMIAPLPPVPMIAPLPPMPIAPNVIRSLGGIAPSFPSALPGMNIGAAAKSAPAFAAFLRSRRRLSLLVEFSPMLISSIFGWDIQDPGPCHAMAYHSVASARKNVFTFPGRMCKGAGPSDGHRRRHPMGRCLPYGFGVSTSASSDWRSRPVSSWSVGSMPTRAMRGPMRQRIS